jgi:hypothetical protein
VCGDGGVMLRLVWIGRRRWRCRDKFDIPIAACLGLDVTALRVRIFPDREAMASLRFVDWYET